MRLNFQVQGHGRPLVILHGFLGSSDNWRSMSRRLSSHFTVYCLDLRNHGQSPHSDAMDYPIMAADLREFVEAQSLAQVFLLGHSMGGKVAMQFAGQYPERVDKLVVVDIAPKAYPPTHQSLLAALRAVDLRAAKNFSDIDAALSGPIPDAAVRQFLMKNLTRDDRGFRWRIALDAIMQNYDELTQAVVIERPFISPPVLSAPADQTLSPIKIARLSAKLSRRPKSKRSRAPAIGSTSTPTTSFTKL